MARDRDPFHGGSSSAVSKPISIAVAVVERDGEFLIGRRPESKPLGGLWEFPGGKIQPGEAPADAAARECFEETGLVIEVGPLYDTIHHRYEPSGAEPFAVKLQFFSCHPIENAMPREPFRWVKAADLARYDFPAANAPVIEQLAGAGR